MTEEQLRQSAWIGDRFCRQPVRGVVISLHGLGFGGLKNGPGFEEQEWGDSGGLVVWPYYGPWSWMNRSSCLMVDQVVSAIYLLFKLNEKIPLIVTGVSMGGQGALIYTRYTKRKVTACLANYPVCDVEYHFTERPDLPPTMRYAFRDEADFENAIVERSPLKQVEKMPATPYLIVHGDADAAVNKQRHSDRFVAAMREHGHDIEYLEVPGMGHASNIPHHATRRSIDFVKQFLLSTEKTQ